MADVDENDDQWLYGSNSAPEGFQNPENPEENEAQDFQKHAPVPFQDDGPPGVDNDYEQEMPDPEPALVPEEIPQEPVNDQPPVLENETEDGELQQNGDDSDKEGLDDDSDDDDINVVIGDIKAPTAYSQPNIKRGGLTTTIGDKSKQVQQSGKFAVEEFDQVGTINGVPSVEYNLDSLEDKPWRKPGADISDYFNYGFNEDTWKAYCERQRRIRMNESGVGVMQITTLGMPRPMVQNFQMPRPMNVPQPEVPKMNTIQVMTADRREYSRKPVGFPDLSVPPPFSDFQPDYSFNPEPEPFYGGGYEPVQEMQWMDGPSPNWQPSDIKTLVGGASPTHSPMGPPQIVRARSRTPERRESPVRERTRDRERESRARSERPRDRSREKSRRRERGETRERSRSRSKSRKHRSSRSRSPSHRSHKKKKSSKRHSDSE